MFVINSALISLPAVLSVSVPKFGFHGDITSGPAAGFVPASKGL